jgi:hypothetical protein
MTAAEFVQFQQRQEAKFICSACGADRGCQCNAPAVERLAEKYENERQAAKAYRERKREEKQQPRHMTRDAGEDDIEADVEPGVINREDLYRAHLIGLYNQAQRTPAYAGPVTDGLVHLVRSLATMWTELANDLEFGLRKKRRRRS